MSFAKQACDCCRVRRVKCNREEPCNRCLEHDLKCTYLRLLKKRGPKSIGARSLKKIAYMQGASEDNSTMTAPKAFVKVPEVLIDQCLRLYNDNLYLIWPLLCYDDLHKLLTDKYDNRSVYWFLVALSAATLSDLQTEIESEEGVSFTGKQLSSICMASRQDFDDLSSSDILKIMTYYCLHRCFAHFSDTITSYRLYCEAIGLIKIARFHCEEIYKPLSFSEQQLRRKVYYLLLLTERYFSVYIHCATSLDTTIFPPQAELVTDPRLSLDSFLEVIRVFTVPEKCFYDALATDLAHDSCTEDSLKRIWKELHTVSPDIEPWSYGSIDFLFSRHWIRTLAWKLMFHAERKRTKFLSNPDNAHIPVKIARDMLGDTFLTPKNYYDVHGPGLPMKTLEIANALVDVVNYYDQNMELEAWNVLCDVAKFFFSLKYCDNKMVQRFSAKCQSALITLPITRPLQSSVSSNDADIIP